MNNYDLVFCKCPNCGTYSFYQLTECVDSCKSCGFPIDLHTQADKNE